MFKKGIHKKIISFLVLLMVFIFFSSLVRSQEGEQVDTSGPEAPQQIPQQPTYPTPSPEPTHRTDNRSKIQEIRFNLDQASQSIASHDYDAAAAYVDKSVSIFQELQGSGGAGLQASLDSLENEIFITHQQAIIGQRKREYDATHIPGKLKNQAQVPSQSHYYDMWSIDRHPWQPD